MKKVKECALSGAVFLAFSGMVAKLLGAVYRIPLTNILGAEGIGLYQLVFPVYSLLIVLTSGSIPTAVAKLVSEKLAFGTKGEAKRVFSAATVLMVITGTIGAVILCLLAKPISKLQGAISLESSYYIVAPSLIFVSLSAALKGWFQGNVNMRPSAVSQLSEQFAKMVFGLLFAFLFAKKSIIAAVEGAMLGLCISEFISLLSVCVYYAFEKKCRADKSKLTLSMNKVVKTAFPITLNSLVLPIVMIIDSFLIVNLLLSRGVGQEEATSLYGIQTGAINSLINMPIVVALALAVSVVPMVARRRVMLDEVAIKDKASVALKIGYLVSIPAFFGLYLLAEDIVKLLYPSFSQQHFSVAVTLLRVSSVTVIFLSQLSIYTSLLQALDKTKVPLIAISLGAIGKILVTVFLIGKISIVAVSFANIVCFGASFLLNASYYKFLLGKNVKLFKNISKILVSGVIMSVCILPILRFVDNAVARVLGSIGVAIVAYVLSLVVMRTLDEDEILMLPFGRVVVRLLNKLKLL